MKYACSIETPLITTLADNKSLSDKLFNYLKTKEISYLIVNAFSEWNYIALRVIEASFNTKKKKKNQIL